jgi:hypothetical protein
MNLLASSQISFSQAEYDKKKKLTRREIFLEKMEQVVPWSRLMQVIEPYYPKSGKRGRPPMGLERMLRMYFVQQWYAWPMKQWKTRSMTQLRCSTSWALT